MEDQDKREEEKDPQRQGCKKEDTEGNYMSVGLSLGLCFGSALGQLFFDNLAMGTSIGMLLGLVIGMNIKKKK